MANTWDRLAEICARYLGKGQQVAIEGRIQTRSWDDERGARHWKTEIVASSVEMVSGRRKKDYAAESAAEALQLQGDRFGVTPVEEAGGTATAPADDDDEDDGASDAAEPLAEAAFAA